MTERVNISSGVGYEVAVGYSRAVRIGQIVAVAGTTAVQPDGSAVGGDNVGEQTREVLRRIANALHQAGATLQDVIRTRIFITDISGSAEVGAAHGDVFGDIRPASSMVEVTALIAPSLLVEIEADAIVSN